MPTAPQRSTSSASFAADAKARYLAALLAGDRTEATAAIDRALDNGLDLPTLLLSVLGAAQKQLGESWHRREITIAQEHWGTQVTTEEIERVLHRRRQSSILGRRVLVATVPGETHTLPARIVAGLLSWRGWAVDYLGSAPPTTDLLDYVRDREPDLVALSMTLTAYQQEASSVCVQLRSLPSPPPILIGGAAAVGLAPESLGASAVASDAAEGLERAAELVGLGGERDLDSYLTVVGRRMQEHRRAARMSQRQLADRAGLTRPYLSAVERGRQNITLEAALRIASALEIDMATLLDESWR